MRRQGLMEFATMSKRILIVDDSLLMRRMIADCLTGAGLEVVAEASSGEEAVASFREHRPDAVTLDIVMPGMGGLSALEQILSIDRQAKVVVVSALNQTRLITEAIRKGASEFIVKPFMPDQLLETLGVCLAAEVN